MVVEESHKVHYFSSTSFGASYNFPSVVCRESVWGNKYHYNKYNAVKTIHKKSGGGGVCVCVRVCVCTCLFSISNDCTPYLYSLAIDCVSLSVFVSLK